MPLCAKFHQFAERPLADSCWSLHAGPDGRIYAASCIEHTGGESATLVRYDEVGDRLEYLFDLDEVTGDRRDSGRATQCKIHYSFAPEAAHDRLYMATHLSGPPKGERHYNPWNAWHDEARAFRGAYLVTYDTARDAVVEATLMIPKEGCRCLCLDPDRRWLYALTYPRDHLVIFDLKTGVLRDRGRIGSVNCQCLFLDRRGRLHFSDDEGRLLRYTPEDDALTVLPHRIAHEAYQTGWHGVLYDAVASPAGDCIYMLPWMVQPHLMRYWPEDGPHGSLEDLGPLTQPRDAHHPLSMSLDHAGGLVFGLDGDLYFARAVWPAGGEQRCSFREWEAVYGEVLCFSPEAGTFRVIAELRRGQPGTSSSYVTRGARDRWGHLYFGHVGARPVGLFRLPVADPAPAGMAHRPLRLWG